jgi:magnesium transporter
MPNDKLRETWEQIEQILAQANAPALRAYLDELPPDEVARALSRMEEDDQKRVVTLLGPEDAADLMEELSDVQAALLLEDLTAIEAAPIIEEMESGERADKLGELDQDDAEAILAQMSPSEAAQTRRLLTHDPHTAGGIMVTEFLAYTMDNTVGGILSDLRTNADQYTDYRVQYTYVVDTVGTLLGVIRLRDLVLSASTTSVMDIMLTKNLVSVPVSATLEDLEHFFDRHDYVGVPALDEAGCLVGIVQRADVEEAHGDQAEQNFMRFSGIVGGDEFRSMPTASRALRRLSFLSPNIVLNLMAAGVIASFQDTLGAVIALAVFLPIISDMSGCSGNQAVAVSIRELSVGLVKPKDYLLVLWKEWQIGLANGLAVGLMLGIVAGVYGRFFINFAHPSGSIYFGLVIGAALATNTMLSVSLGGLVPLALKSRKIDPALASGPILTTVTDMCGFFLVLGMATLALKYLAAG